MALPGLLGPDARLQRLPSWFPFVGNQKAPVVLPGGGGWAAKSAVCQLKVKEAATRQHPQ